MNDVFISGLGTFYPNQRLANSDIDLYIGAVDGFSEKAKNQLLKINGIENRYYALEKGGKPTHLSEEMGYHAACSAIQDAGIEIGDIDLLSFGTSVSDLVIPSISHQIHGQLGKNPSAKPLRIMPTAGVCLSGIFSLDIAANYLASRPDRFSNAIVGGVERPSISFVNHHYTEESLARKHNVAEFEHYKFMHGAFLRYMLSDGAGAALLTNNPQSGKRVFRIEWIEIRSYANELPTCMYAGTNEPTNLTPCSTYIAQATMGEAAKRGMTVLRQNPSILGEYIVPYAVREMKTLMDEGRLLPQKVDWFLPHISSFAFYQPLQDEMSREGVSIPTSKWFLNLAERGNTGAAYIYGALTELARSDRITPGEKLLLMVPESARFGYGFIQLSYEIA